MIHSLDTVPVALMDRIDPHVLRGPLGIGPASFADGNPRWLGFRKLRRPLPVSHAVPQIVKMRRRNLRQVGILALAEDLPLPFYDSAGRRPTELLVSPIHFDQQLQILTRVFDRKSLPWTAPHGEFASGVVAPDQARNLRHAQPAQLAEQGSHPTALLLAQSEVLLLHQRGHDPLVNSAPALAGKIDLRTGLKEIINPIQRQRFRILHQNLHPPHSVARFRFQDHPALETKSISGSSRIGQFSAEDSASRVLQSNSVFQRVIWIVLDSVGIGAMPDAAAFHDPAGADTLGNIARLRGRALPTPAGVGPENINRLAGIAPAASPEGAYGRCALASPGKDTTTGHWEMVGIHLDRPFPLYPNGFPREVLD